MNSNPQSSLENQENNALDALLKQSPNTICRDQFVDQVMQVARSTPQSESSISAFVLKPSFLRSHPVFMRVGALAAAIVIAISCLSKIPTQSAPNFTRNTNSSDSDAQSNLTITTDEFAELQQVADQEVLLAATEHMNEFSDSELASLMGF